jgi:hypothetical protein
MKICFSDELRFFEELERHFLVSLIPPVYGSESKAPESADEGLVMLTACSCRVHLEEWLSQLTGVVQD